VNRVFCDKPGARASLSAYGADVAEDAMVTLDDAVAKLREKHDIVKEFLPLRECRACEDSLDEVRSKEAPKCWKVCSRNSEDETLSRRGPTANEQSTTALRARTQSRPPRARRPKQPLRGCRG
jgi:hypothetical protein